MNIGGSMRNVTFTGVLLAALLVFSACAQKTDEYEPVKFKDRTVDIEKFFTEFPYTAYAITMSDDAGRLFYTRNGETSDLMMLELSNSTDLDDGVRICNEDFSKKNLWDIGYNEADKYLYWTGDEKNDEIINLYRFDIGTGEKIRLTDVPYIYGWSFDEDKSHIAYIGRMGQNEARLDELHILNLKTLEDKLVYTDKPEYRMTWSEIALRPDGSGAVLNVLKDADRTYTNVAYVDFKTQKLKVITDPSKEGSHDGTEPLCPWYDNNTVYFKSNQSGYANIYSYNVTTGRTRQVTDYGCDISADWLDVDGRKLLAVVSNSPAGSRLAVVDPLTGKELASSGYDADIAIKTTVGGDIYLSVGAVDIVFEMWKVSYDGSALKEPEVIVALSKEKEEALVRSTVERLEIPTFDVDEKTGETRKLHAYLLTPKKPLKDKIVMIQSFYGGGNSYDMEHQIFADAGIYVLSPSPRGTSGFGRDFAAMNDKDLGGNEIIDIIYCAKYISEKLGVPPERVGVFGMSHGGYATMRLMTFPGEVNGNKAEFPFGFGVAVAGFADIVYQHYHSNIPDWTMLEAGDPEKDHDKLMDRSPISHYDKITGPLLLIHGNHDDRVDIEGSRMMYNALKEIGKQVEFLEIDGQGHGFKGIDNNMLYYTAILNFIDNL